MTYTLAHIYNHDGTGGGNKQASLLLRAWAATDDIDPIGVHAANLNSPENFVSDELEYPLMYPSNIGDGLREIDPDIVFVHGFSPVLNDLLREVKESGDTDAKFVCRKGMNLYEHWGLIFKDRNPRKITDQVTALDWYDCIVCPTIHVRDRISMFYGGDCPQLAYIPNAINRDQYVPSSFMADGTLRVMTASRGGPNDFLLSPLLAVARLLDGPDIPVKLEMYGANFDPIDQVIRSLAADYDDIEVAGYHPREQVKHRMEAADIVCVPSISHQAVPLAAVEGLAAGNIVLASFPEADEEEAIIKMPATHPPAWYEAIKDAYEDPDDAREWVRKGIEAAARYDVSTIVNDGYLPVFEDLLDE